MSIELYDLALTNKLKYWTKNSLVTVLSPDDTTRTFEMLSDELGDTPIELPIICLRRKRDFRIRIKNKLPLSYDGMTLEADIDKSVLLNAIPITLNYLIDVYARYLQDATELVRNLIFNIVNFPSFDVILQYNNETIEHSSTIYLSESVADNSNISERIISGQFSRFTLDIEVNDAYLWDVRTRDNKFIELEVNEN